MKVMLRIKCTEWGLGECWAYQQPLAILSGVQWCVCLTSFSIITELVWRTLAQLLNCLRMCLCIGLHTYRFAPQQPLYFKCTRSGPNWENIQICGGYFHCAATACDRTYANAKRTLAVIIEEKQIDAQGQSTPTMMMMKPSWHCMRSKQPEQQMFVPFSYTSCMLYWHLFYSTRIKRMCNPLLCVELLETILITQKLNHFIQWNSKRILKSHDIWNNIISNDR